MAGQQHTGSDPAAREALERARAIVAYTREDGGDPHVRELALRTAGQTGARVILYPLDVGSPFSNPVPANWAAEGTREQYGNPLSVSDLEMLGREELAAQLVEASGTGVEAGAWLPEDPGVDAMAEYAEEQGASVILIPSGLEDPGPIEKLTGKEEPAEVAEERTAVEIIRVAPDGSLRRE